VQKDYAAAAAIFDHDVVTGVPFFGVTIEGATANIFYFYLNDGDVTDLCDIVNQTTTGRVIEYFSSRDPRQAPYAKVTDTDALYFINL
jgi:hypothetical protein